MKTKKTLIVVITIFAVCIVTILAGFLHKNPWVGKSIKFNSTMLYVRNSFSSDDYSRRINRKLVCPNEAKNVIWGDVSRYEIQKLPQSNTYTVEHVIRVEDPISYTINVYGHSKGYDIAVVRDQQGVESTLPMSSVINHYCGN